MTYQSFNPASGKLLKKFEELTDAQLAAKLANPTWTSDHVVTRRPKSVKRTAWSSTLAACFFVVFAVPPVAAQSPSDPAANQCLTDLRAFHDQMQKGGYWLGGYYGTGDPGLGGYGYGYGYPLSGYGYEYGVGDSPAETGGGYFNARPGYEIRMLLTAADILARHDQLQPCEDLLAATRDHYEQYVAEMETAGMEMADVPGWQERQIAAAQPVASTTTPFRSDQLLGTDVRNLQNEALGSIDDLVTSPQTGEIAYLLIARGGWLFGLGEQYVAVPWDAFKVAPNATLLVLDATKGVMDGAPQVNSNDFTAPGQNSLSVDTYWEKLIASQGNN
uniref:PRC-barrel domain-containing protein n=1 Tax=Pararhizobium sp. IMCC3301 TaxID=3067904 RepID=UPI002741DCB6|nr:PRC-barrel domain-containing protein [Pararhizobium sp. IMCC3301]